MMFTDRVEVVENLVSRVHEFNQTLQEKYLQKPLDDYIGECIKDDLKAFNNDLKVSGLPRVIFSFDVEGDHLTITINRLLVPRPNSTPLDDVEVTIPQYINGTYDYEILNWADR